MHQMQEAAFLTCRHNVFDIKSLQAHLREGGFVVSVIERNILSVSKLFIFNKSEHLGTVNSFAQISSDILAEV